MQGRTESLLSESHCGYTGGQIDVEALEGSCLFSPLTYPRPPSICFTPCLLTNRLSRPITRSLAGDLQKRELSRGFILTHSFPLTPLHGPTLAAPCCWPPRFSYTQHSGTRASASGELVSGFLCSSIPPPRPLLPQLLP